MVPANLVSAGFDSQRFLKRSLNWGLGFLLWFSAQALFAETPKVCPPADREVDGMPVNYNHCQAMPEMNGCPEFMKEYLACRPNRKILTQYRSFPKKAPGMAEQSVLGYCTGDRIERHDGKVHRYYKIVVRESSKDTPGRLSSSGKYTFLYSYLDQDLKDFQGKKIRACTQSWVYNFDKSNERPFNSPNLYFNEGEVAEIDVVNFSKQNLTIHWHGLLIENNMDGVPNVTQASIKPGATFSYKFELKQNGTYWYHPHTGLQEQHLKGAITIFPKAGVTDPIFANDKTKYHHERVLLLNDFKAADSELTRNRLMMGMGQYQFESGLYTDLYSAIRIDGLAGFKKYFNNLATMGMPNMDKADIWYDAFFINDSECLNCGVLKNQLKFPTAKNSLSDARYQFKKGERIRLRLINGSGSSYFYVNYANEMDSEYNPKTTSPEEKQRIEERKHPMIIVAKDGRSIKAPGAFGDVDPLSTDQILIGMGETYDVIVEITEDNTAFELLVKSYDDFKSGRLARVLIGSSTRESTTKVNRARNPQVYLWGNADDDGIYAQAKYSDMNSIESFNPPVDSQGEIPPLQQFNFRLHMDMDNYKSQILVDHKRDKETHSETVLKKDGHGMDYFVVPKGNRIQLNFNNSMIEGMMNHPIHLHGNYFRLTRLNPKQPEKGYDVTETWSGAELHTANVFPGQKLGLEFYVRSDQEEALAVSKGEPPTHGCWMIHCHNLYHMSNSMMMYLKTGDSVCPAEAQENPKDHHAGSSVPSQTQISAEASGAQWSNKVIQFNVRGGVNQSGLTEGAGFKATAANGNRGQIYVNAMFQHLSPAFDRATTEMADWSAQGEVKYCRSREHCVFLSIYDEKQTRSVDKQNRFEAYVGGSYQNYSIPWLSPLAFRAGVGVVTENSKDGKSKTAPALNLETDLRLPLFPNTIGEMGVGCRGEYCKDLFVGASLSNRSLSPFIELRPQVGYSVMDKGYVGFEAVFHFEPISMGGSHE